MSTTDTMFSLSDLSPFECPGATVEPRREGFFRGCYIKFENGWSVSVQWGYGSYGSNYDTRPPSDDASEAEVAVFTPTDGMVTWLDGDSVQGYCSMERVQRILDLVTEGKLMREYRPPVEMRADDSAP